MPMKIFVPIREKDRYWRKFHKEELHDLYSSANIMVIKKDEMNRACNTHEGEAIHTGFWCGNMKRLLGRRRRHWEDNIKIDLKWDARAWTGFVWLRMETSGGLL
jgi:hypothetical protein